MPSRTAQVEVIVFKIVDDEVLFLVLKRNEQKGGFWQSVTGGVHEGEGLNQAAKRELWEETGIIQYVRLIEDVHYFEFETNQGGILKEYVFGVQVSPDTDITLSSEHTEMRWCSLRESLTLLKYDSNKTAFQKLFVSLTALG